MKNKSSIGPLKDGDKVVSDDIGDDIGMANDLNKFFATVFTIENDNLPAQIPCDLPEKLDHIDIPENSVQENKNLNQILPSVQIRLVLAFFRQRLTSCMLLLPLYSGNLWKKGSFQATSLRFSNQVLVWLLVTAALSPLPVFAS